MNLFDLCVAKKLSAGSGESQSIINGFVTKSIESLRCTETSIPYQALQNFSHLSTVDFPELLEIPAAAFANCMSLENCNFPKVEKIGPIASAGGDPFYTAGKIGAEITFPSCTDVQYGAFRNSCFGRINLPVATNIWINAFESCNHLTAVVLGKRATITTDITGYLPESVIFYVDPSDLLWYSADENWSPLYQSGRIKSAEELPS